MTGFLRNCWYAAALTDELAEGAILARRILDTPIALWRGPEGAPGAMVDRCPHRSLPLSEGKIEGARLRCGYHGLLFERDGRCAEVPGQSLVPPGMAVETFALVERHRFIWIWMGDRTQADEALIPDFHANDHADWRSVNGRFHVGGSYRLLIDNLLDLSHVQFVHAGTLGTGHVVDFPVEVRRGPGRVHVDRWIMGGPPPGMFATAGGIDYDVDRWQCITWTPPGHVVIDAGCSRAGTGARDGTRVDAVELFSNHTITPETGASAHYFWHHARNFRLDDDEVTDYLGTAAESTFAEDVVLIEAQQKAIDDLPADFPTVDINADAGVLQARRMLDEMIAAESR